MPTRPLGPCSYPGCPNRATDHGRCARHPRPQAARPSAAERGYGAGWQHIRAEVLTAHSIPASEWPLYDVDHNPPYNRAIEPDHRKYTLTPRLHGEHSQKTAAQDGGFGNRRR